MPEPSLDLTRIKAVVFDVDGTLYRQGPLRRAMATRLLLAHVWQPRRGLQTLRVLATYRRAQEELRNSEHSEDLAREQLHFAAQRTGVSPETAAAYVEHWMERSPLDILPRLVHPGLEELLSSLRTRGIKLGVLSDYPAEAKLKALGIGGHFDTVVCAQAREVGAFKPNPRGLRLVLERLGVDATHALYVGDRVEVDAAVAAAAGVPCAILSPKARAAGAGSHFYFGGFQELRERLVPA